jgi:hypothetical protein
MRSPRIARVYTRARDRARRPYSVGRGFLNSRFCDVPSITPSAQGGRHESGVVGGAIERPVRDRRYVTGDGRVTGADNQQPEFDPITLMSPRESKLCRVSTKCGISRYLIARRRNRWETLASRPRSVAFGRRLPAQYAATTVRHVGWNTDPAGCVPTTLKGGLGVCSYPDVCAVET